MAKGTRHLRTLFKTRSKTRSKYRKYLDGDWKMNDRSGFGLSLTCTSEAGDEEHSVSSFSTNATMDNNIGPGRMLDKLYQYLGRKVEWSILRISIASLHPITILNCLWDETHVCIERAGRPMSEIIASIHRRKGSAAVAGLKSLVHQTQ